MRGKPKEPDPFSTTLIEYLHVVGFFSSSPARPLSLARDLTTLLGTVIGEDQLGPELAGFLASATSPSAPSAAWTWSPELKAFSITEGGTVVKERLSAPDLVDSEAHLRGLLVARDRRGAKLKMFDHMWCLDYHAEAVYPLDHFDAESRLSVRTSYFFDKPEGPKPKQLIDETMRHMVEAGDLYYGLVTCSQFREDAGGIGLMQEGAASNWSSLRLQTDHDLWARLGTERRKKVHGLYWGQYLSPWHLERLGGKEAFKEAYITTRGPDLRYRFQDLVTDYPGAGLFVRVSHHPMNYSSKGLDVPCGDLGAWLHTRFKKADLLL